MTKVNPTRIAGRWREGFVLDLHTESSVHVGDDQFGHPQFETLRTPLGELLYRLKYKSDKSVVQEIVDTASRFVRKWKPRVDLLVPAPPSRKRREQPLFLLAEPLAEALGVEFSDVVKKAREVPELKDIHDFHRRSELLAGAFRVDKEVVEGQAILLLTIYSALEPR